LFLRAHDDGLLAGTWYLPWKENEAPRVSGRAIADSLADLQRCLPGLPCTPARVRSVMAGVLPDRDGSGRALRDRDVFIDHGRRGGPRGLYSVLGVKLTTARALSARVADHVASSLAARRDAKPLREPATDVERA
jgi:glycerol-3-phosphate dehydrogenase